MTTLHGTLRSTDTQMSEGLGSDMSEARRAALAGLDLEAFELQQANVGERRSTGEIVIHAKARSRTTKPHEATGPTYEAALQAFRSTVDDGWQILHFTAAD